MLENGKMSFFAKIIVLLFIAACVVMIVRLQMQCNELEERVAEAEAIQLEYEDHIEELEQQLEAPFDEEYIARIAREQMNLYEKDDVIVYND